MPHDHPDLDMIALGVRQPWADLIVSGLKTVEVRSQSTNQRGRIYIYASKRIADTPHARAAAESHSLDVESLPKGVLVGTVELVGAQLCTASDARAACLPPQILQNRYAWRLAEPQRLEHPLEVRYLPYGIWFYPFRRRSDSSRSRRSP